MGKSTSKSNPRYKQGINKIVLSSATFARSNRNVIEPTWINFLYGNNGSGKTTITRAIRDSEGITYDKPDINFNKIIFNQDFIESEIDFDELKAVFTLSKDASDKYALIEEKLFMLQ